jgi:hypothetical protein
MSSSDHYLRMRLVEKTAAAVKVTASKRPPENGQALFFQWIPRSLIGYSRTEPALVDGEFPQFTFTLPEWKIERDNLWAHVTDAR